MYADISEGIYGGVRTAVTSHPVPSTSVSSSSGSDWMRKRSGRRRIHARRRSLPEFRVGAAKIIRQDTAALHMKPQIQKPV